MARARLPVSILAVICVLLAFPASAVVPPIKQPNWVELTQDQQRILAPLSGEWDRLESYRKKKWLGIAKRYPVMSPDEQARIQKRMAAWAKMTPAERQAAREKYLALQKAPAAQKEAVKQRWQEYKALPDDEKNRLKNEATRHPSPKPSSGRVAYPSPPPAPAPSKPAN